MTPEAMGHPGDLLSAHLDDELPPSVAAEVEAHIASCAACRAELDELDGARTTLRSLPRLEAPAGFTRDIVRTRHAKRVGIVPWVTEEPVGPARLLALARNEEPRSIAAGNP